MAREFFKNEEELVRWLERRAAKKQPGVKAGIGDDAAIVELSPRRQTILSTDLSIEGVHFSHRYHPPDSVGYRGLARSLSDMAAMGAAPRYALIALALSANQDRPWIESLYEGMLRLARRFNVSILGGDTVRHHGPSMLDVVAVGETPRGRALLRSGAKPGDRIFVAGTLGLSALGLKLLRRKASAGRPPSQQALAAHLYPEPQCSLGEFLAEERLASAAIDLSDGLSTDLGRLCKASGAGARVWAAHIPCPSLPGFSKSVLLDLALNGGEDYKLLFTVRPSKGRLLPASFDKVRLYPIGEICLSRHITLVREDGTETPLPAGGYDHFRHG